MPSTPTVRSQDHQSPRSTRTKPTLTGSPAFLKKEKTFFLLSVFSIALIAQDCDCFGNCWLPQTTYERCDV
jgi:hypothetical protein